MFHIKHSAAVVGWTAIAALTALLAAAAANAGEDRTHRDARAALPAASDLGGFGDITKRDHENGTELVGVRQSDGLRVRVNVSLALDATGARRFVNPWSAGTQVPMPARSHTGRATGDRVYHTARYHGGGPPRGTFALVSRIGRVAVMIQLMHRITEVRNGSPVEPVFSEADLRWAEDVAIGCVERLKKMGYGDEQEKKARSKTKGDAKPKGK